MARFSALVLAGALVCLVTSLTIQAQQQPPVLPQGGGQGAGRGRGQVTLPDGNGKEFVQTVCVACHQLNMITGSAGGTRQAWLDLIRTMVLLPEEQFNIVGDYLAKNFPEKPDRRPTLVAGNV